VMTLVLGVLGYPNTVVEYLTALVYLLLTFYIYWVRIKFELSLEIVDLGWIIMLMANLGFISGQMSLAMTYAFSIIGKVIVFLWMSRPSFVEFTDEMETFLVSGNTPSQRSYKGISIVESAARKEDDIQWMKTRLQRKDLQDVRKILVMTSEVYNRNELNESGLLGIPNLYIIQMTQAFHPQKPVFADKVVSISNDLNILNAMLGEIISFVNEKSLETCIIVNSFSTLIHVHGWRSLYAMLISNIPQLKQSKISAFIMISPLSHENQHEIVQLRQFGDDLIKI
jgi:hypothetical protein